MPTIHFIEGPCDGRTRTVAQSVVDRGTVTCDGTLYVHYIAGASGPSIVFVPADSTLGRAQTGADNSPIHATQAWSRWMRILAHRGPESHRRALAVAARARKIARHR